MSFATARLQVARPLTGFMCAALIMGPAPGNATVDPSTLQAYFRPFATTNNLSGTVLVERAGTVLFARSYGFSDRTKKIPNRLDTRYHIASLSILFTSTAVLRLIDQGKLSFDTRVAQIVPGVPNGDEITIRELLEQTSGLPDSHDFPNYGSLLTRHQTPQSLVDFIRNRPPYEAPGTANNGREEHSGQNLLALIIERITGLSFKQAMQIEVFDPIGMRDSGIDDDDPIPEPVARGNRAAGAFGLKAAPAIHWSALPGNGSAYTTVRDEWKWLHALVHGRVLSATSRDAMLGVSEGYGWEKYTSQRLGETVYAAGGRSTGGFSCFLEYLPGDDTLVLALTNIENAANPIIIANAAALLRGKPYQRFEYTYVAPAVAGFPQGYFTFGKDFYRSSATLTLVSDANGVTLNWPGGPAAALLPLSKDHFMDRYYWCPVTVIRDRDDKPVQLGYCKFKGTIQSNRGG